MNRRNVASQSTHVRPDRAGRRWLHGIVRGTSAVIAFTFMFGRSLVPAYAGCGCEKPPPPLADVRPAFASPGNEIRLFSSKLKVGREYTVLFVAETGDWESRSAFVVARAERRRDFADGVSKVQLLVAAPKLAAGPASVTVLAGLKPVLHVPTGAFTMLQPPLALAEEDARTTASCYRAAVGTDGTVYLPLDLTEIGDRMLFSGVGMDYPLLFGAADVAIYNTQGVLMQLLGPEQAGIFAIADTLGAPHSFELVYDRHEFNSYRSMHAHEGGYGLDPADPAWHTNGTRHIDHDHLVIAIHGLVEGEGRPAPGQTPPFTLDIATMSPEHHGSSVQERRIRWSSECDE
jgi:hypothetical protein